MSGTWISDRPEAEEHPVVPIGLNEMAVPRISILASFGTIAMLLLSAIWLGLAANSFLNQFEDAFAAVAEEDIQVDGRWTWEATLLFDGCDARNGDWNWPAKDIEIQSSVENDYFTVEIAITLDSLSELGLLKGNRLETGIYRAKYKQQADETYEPTWITWVDPKTEVPDFHIASSFGCFIFEGI